MTTSAKTITVTRTELALGTLDVSDEATYFILFDGFSAGGGRWERNMVSGPYTDGEYEVGKRLRNTEAELGIAVKATTQTALDTAIAALVDPDTGAVHGPVLLHPDRGHRVVLAHVALLRRRLVHRLEGELDRRHRSRRRPVLRPARARHPDPSDPRGRSGVVAQTDGGKNLTIRALFGTDHSVVIPSPLYVALMATAPGATDDGGDLDEPTDSEYPAYTRASVANTDANWSVSGDEASNIVVVSFPSSAASGGTVAVLYFAITTSPSAGEVLVWGQLPSPVTIGAASVLPRFPAGTLRVTSADPIPL